MLGQGEISLAPGASAEHGVNLAPGATDITVYGGVSCPAVVGDACGFTPRQVGGEVGVSCPAEGAACIMSKVGADGLASVPVSEPEVYGWGAWGRYSAWGVGVQRTLEVRGGILVEPDERHFHDRLLAGADAFGIEPATTVAQNSVLASTATWSGSLLGVDLGQDMLPPVLGDAELQLNLTNLVGIARFNDLTVFVENEGAPFRQSSLEYAIDGAQETRSQMRTTS